MMKVDKLLGKEVITEDAMHLGSVDSVAIDMSDWSVPLLKVCLEKGMEVSLGVKKPMFSAACLFMRTSTIDSVADAITLTVPQDSMKEHLIHMGSIDVHTAGELIGKKVISKEAKEMGVLSSLIIDELKWTVTHIEVKLTKQAISDMGLRSSISSGRMFRLNIDDVRTVGDMVLLSIDSPTVKNHIEGAKEE